MSKPLEFTGERFTPECSREIWYEHLHRYAFAVELVKGLDVLDAACGEGYGSALLASTARSVQAVDISEQAIAHARGRYARAGVEFHQADCLALPFEADSFDVIVSFETLEHLEQHDELMSEFRRVLRPQGFLLISSPDKAVYSDRMQHDNPFHVCELYRHEFESLLSRHFPAFRLLGQKLLFESAIWALDEGSGIQLQQENAGQLASLPKPGHDPVYFLALCAASDRDLPNLPAGLSLFDDSEDSVCQHYYHEIRKNMAAGGVLEEKEREINRLKDELAAEKALSWWRKLLG